MNSFRSGNVQGDFGLTHTNQLNNECAFTSGIDKDSPDTEKPAGDIHLANESIGSARSAHSGASSSEVFSPSGPKQQYGHRPKSARAVTPKSLVRHVPPLSSIPLPVKTSGPIKISPLLKNVRSNSRTSSVPATRTTSALANKHTLEIQFINKNKRYVQMRKELSEKQRPVLDLYQNLTQIKKRLEQLGKCVKLEEIKFITYEEYNAPSDLDGAGELVSMEIVGEMKTSIEEIPKTLMDICKNLLSRRALIVELLESVTKSEVDVSEVSDKIESLKNEGQQLQHSLDAVIREHQLKINVLVGNWQKLLSDKQSYKHDSKIEELESKLEDQERLTQESNNVIRDLYRKIEERKSVYEKSVNELNGVIQSLKDHIKKLEQDLDSERKTTTDFKVKTNANSQNLKSMRAKITELENEKKSAETDNAEMQKKIRLLQDQIKHKENNWNKERDELNKNLKHQENLLQKLTADKNQFETRFKTIENEEKRMKTELEGTITSLGGQLNKAKSELENVTKERDAALGKCAEFEKHVTEIRTDFKETMNKVSCSIKWGKGVKGTVEPAVENYIQDIAKDLRIRELQDRMDLLEKDGDEFFKEKMQMDLANVPIKIAIHLKIQQECITRYQSLLNESEERLQEKSNELEILHSEIRQLKVRQSALEEQNLNCPVSELQQMVKEGRLKLDKLLKRSTESEHTVEKYAGVIEKQSHQIKDMENLLRYRENITKVLKSSREELLLEKESLLKYSNEIRTILSKVSKQAKIKSCMAIELQEKVHTRERQIKMLKNLVQKLEEKLVITHEKRFRLQEVIGTMEKQIQSNKEHFNLLKSAHYHNQPSYLSNTVSRKDNSKTLKLWQPQSSHSTTEFEDNYFSPNTSQTNVKVLSNSRKSFNDKINNTHISPEVPQTSNKRVSYKSLLIFNDSHSDHTNCQHKVNSRSLISLSLRTVDFLKTRINFLTSVDVMLPSNADIPSALAKPQKRENRRIDETAQPRKVSDDRQGKVRRLNAKCCEYYQNQDNESNEELNELCKLSISKKRKQ